MQQTNFTDIMEKNHMEIPWHDYTQNNGNILINQAPVPQDSIISPTRPMTDAFSISPAWCNLYGRCRINVD